MLDDELISAWTAGPGKPGLASAKDVPRLVQAVRQARATSDTVIVFLHWGIELQQCPSPDQRTLAKQLVAAGADVVVGGHAHRVQGAGRMGKALVDYGLGNFVWYGTSELSTQTGVLLVTVDGRKVLGYRWEPARHRGWNAPAAGWFRTARADRVVAIPARMHRPAAVAAIRGAAASPAAAAPARDPSRTGGTSTGGRGSYVARPR